MILSEKDKEDIYRRFYGKVFGYIISKIRNQADAEDLASEVFVKIYKNIDNYDESKASLSTWIYTITRNMVTDHFRTHKQFEELTEMPDDEPSIQESICNEETLQALTRALGTLEGRERDVIILRYYSGKTLKEIAVDMGISYPYVKVIQNNAMNKLRKLLENQ